MSRLKMLGLTALAVSVMALVPGPASATVLDKGEPLIHGEGERFVEVHLPLTGTTAFCSESTFIGNVTVEGSSTTTAEAALSKFAFGFCLGAIAETKAAGTLEFHTAEPSGNNDGTVTSSGLLIRVNREGLTCWYETSNTDFGVDTGSTGTLDVKASVPLWFGGPFCSPNAIVEGSFQTNFIVT